MGGKAKNSLPAYFDVWKAIFYLNSPLLSAEFSGRHPGVLLECPVKVGDSGKAHIIRNFINT